MLEERQDERRIEALYRCISICNGRTFSLSASKRTRSWKVCA